MELSFLGNKYTKSNEPKEKSVVQLKYLQGLPASMRNQPVTALQAGLADHGRPHQVTSRSQAEALQRICLLITKSEGKTR